MTTEVGNTVLAYSDGIVNSEKFADTISDITLLIYVPLLGLKKRPKSEKGRDGSIH